LSAIVALLSQLVRRGLERWAWLMFLDWAVRSACLQCAIMAWCTCFLSVIIEGLTCGRESEQCAADIIVRVLRCCLHVDLLMSLDAQAL